MGYVWGIQSATRPTKAGRIGATVAQWQNDSLKIFRRI